MASITNDFGAAILSICNFDLDLVVDLVQHAGMPRLYLHTAPVKLLCVPSIDQPTNTFPLLAVRKSS